LNFGTVTASAVLNLENGGDLPLGVKSVTENEAWLDVTEGTVDANKLGTYIVSVDRTGLAEGTYAATIAIISDANDVEVPVNMQVGGIITGGNVGFHYVLLVDAETLQPVAQDNVPFDGSGYPYAFQDVAPGTYKIFAGTDSDDDSLIGDAGEAFGAYLTLDQPSSVTINDNRSRLDFATGFDVSLPSRMGVGPLGVERRVFKVLPE
jgi:serine protease